MITRGMNTERLDTETEAYSAFSELLKQARKVRGLFEISGLPLPDPLTRLIGDGKGAESQPPRMTISPPDSPERPPEAAPDWLWVDMKDLSVTILVFGLLRNQTEPTTPKALFHEIRKHLPGANQGSIFNCCSREAGSTLEKVGKGWVLKNKAVAPILYKGRAWGARPVFGKYELAAHRRYGILHLLRMYPSGLQILQATEYLRSAPWCQAPVSKDLVKMDMKILSDEELVSRRGNSRKWALCSKRRPKKI